MKGTITKLRVWKSNKGCFVGIDNGEKDYMYNKVPKIAVGDVVEYDTGKPTDDGKPTISKLVLIGGPVEAFVDEDKPRSDTIPPYRAHDWKDDVDVRRMKLRVDCLRLAVDANSNDVVPAELLIEASKKFEKYVRE